MAGTNTIVDIRGVSKVYRSETADVEALSAINIGIFEAEFISVVGPSGCGKSTLLKCIAGLEATTTGTISVRGVPVSGPPEDMGVVFQSDLLLDWRTVIENVLIVSEFRGTRTPALKARAAELLTRFGLKDYISHSPWELSGGMRQRVAICRAILDDPELLLMDEPFGALDAMTRDDLNLELAKLSQETRKTVIFITHSIDEAVLLSDRVVIMAREPGRVVEIVDIDLPHPRTLSVRDSVEFIAVARRIRDKFIETGAFRVG